MSASSMRSVTEGDFPVNGSTRQRLEFALKYAALAPTEGNWQPWKFRVADTCLELLARAEPGRADADPEGREAIIGCGAALVYLKLALKHFGCLGRVAWFPDLGEPALVARVHFGFCLERDPQEKLLFEAMTPGPAAVSRLGESPVSETMLAALGCAANGDRAWLDLVLSEARRQEVLKLSQGGDESWRHLDRARGQPNQAAASGNHPRRPRLLFAFEGRKLEYRNVAAEPVRPASVAAATLAIVKTKTDDQPGWLAAGQTMARTVLRAQVLGMLGIPDPVRRREARSALRMGVGHKGFAQVILRFGPLLMDEMVRPAAAAAVTTAFG